MRCSVPLPLASHARRITPGMWPLAEHNLPIRHLERYYLPMSELVFEVTQEQDGAFCAECLSENIFTQGDTWEAMRQNVQEAVRAYYFDQPGQGTKRIRLRLVRDELLAST